MERRQPATSTTVTTTTTTSAAAASRLPHAAQTSAHANLSSESARREVGGNQRDGDIIQLTFRQQGQHEEVDGEQQGQQSGQRRGQRVTWDEAVVDNEHMNKKKSKSCCIFHKKKSFGDWSDSDSDEDDVHACCSGNIDGNSHCTN